MRQHEVSFISYEKYRVRLKSNDKLQDGPRPKQQTDSAIYARREDDLNKTNQKKRQFLTSLV